MPEPRRRGGSSFSWLRHRSLIATEAVLLVGLAKDWITSAVHASSLPNYGKVLFVMGATIGILGGLFFVLERMLARGVAGTHARMKSLPIALPTLAVHVLILGALFLVYANHLRLAVL